MNKILLAKTNLCLGRMHIHVHLFRRHFQKKEHDRIGRWRNDVAVRFPNGMQQEAITNKPLVYKNIDGITIQLLQFRS